VVTPVMVLLVTWKLLLVVMGVVGLVMQIPL
jgi:hypothetical protein